VHKEISIKINGMFNECFYLCKFVVKRFLLVPRMPLNLNRLIGPRGSGSRTGNGVVPPDAAGNRPAPW